MNAYGRVPAGSIRAMGLDELNRFHSESGGTCENLLIGMESISSICAEANTEDEGVNRDVYIDKQRKEAKEEWDYLQAKLKQKQ